MLLIGVKEDEGWLLSRWNLTYRVSWEQICKAAASVYNYYDGLEILVDDEVIELSSKEDVLKIEEARNLTFRGVSQVIKVPMMITLYNQLKEVDVNIPIMADGEFSKADYQSFNMSLGQYLDSIEIAMHR